MPLLSNPAFCQHLAMGSWPLPLSRFIRKSSFFNIFNDWGWSWGLWAGGVWGFPGRQTGTHRSSQPGVLCGFGLLEKCVQVPWKGRVRVSPEAPRLWERQNQPRGRVSGAAVNHSSQRKGDCLGSRETARCSQESWVLQVPEAACLSCFLRQCAAHTTCQVNPNSPSCLAPKVLGLFWSRAVREQILVQKSWRNTWGQKSKLYLQVLGIYSSELWLGILVWSSGPPVPSMLSKTTETITTMPLSLGCLIPSTASRYLHFVSGGHIQGNLKKEYLNCF